jgi:hypothetical protein
MITKEDKEMFFGMNPDTIALLSGLAGVFGLVFGGACFGATGAANPGYLPSFDGRKEFWFDWSGRVLLTLGLAGMINLVVVLIRVAPKG